MEPAAAAVAPPRQPLGLNSPEPAEEELPGQPLGLNSPEPAEEAPAAPALASPRGPAPPAGAEAPGAPAPGARGAAAEAPASPPGSPGGAAESAPASPPGSPGGAGGSAAGAAPAAARESPASPRSPEGPPAAARGGAAAGGGAGGGPAPAEGAAAGPGETDDEAAAGEAAARPPPEAALPSVESPVHSPWPVGAPPRVGMGSKLDKWLYLTPDRWVKMGRDEASQLHLPGSGVSRHHCRLLWDTHRRIVELRDTSSTGTMVNGEIVKNAHRTLRHADLLRVAGRGVRYDFVLDLRPCRLGFGDPVQAVRDLQQSTRRTRLDGDALLSRRGDMEAQLRHLDESIRRSEARASETERRYYEVLAQRKQRAAEDKLRNEQLLGHERGAAALEQRIKESREEWLAKLQLLYESNQEAERPLVEDLRVVKDKTEKMRYKKDEIERALNPEKYMVKNAEDDLGGLLELGAAPPAESLPGGEDEEEQAFVEKPPADAPSATAVAAAAAAAVKEADPMADIFGDFDSADEAEAARDAALEKANADEEEGDGEPLAKRPREA